MHFLLQFINLNFKSKNKLKNVKKKYSMNLSKIIKKNIFEKQNQQAENHFELLIIH